LDREGTPLGHDRGIRFIVYDALPMALPTAKMNRAPDLLLTSTVFYRGGTICANAPSLEKLGWYV